jgi:predicted AlkP superfamily pyrophosphatase or phosphodiesterase
MKKIYISLIILIVSISLLLTACESESSVEKTSLENGTKTILISIDAMTAKYWQDESLDLPNLRMLMADGAFAEKVNVVYPSSTWVSHSSIITGGYPKKTGILGNWTVDTEKKAIVEIFGDMGIDKEQVMEAETLYDLAHENGYSTASICWPVTRGATKIDYNIPEFYAQVFFDNFATKDFWNELKEAGLPVHRYGDWSADHSKVAMQDKLTADTAIYLIENQKPDLMMVHFLSPDSFGHDYGPDSPEVIYTLEYVDALIGEIVKSLKEEDMFDSTNIFITADHGMSLIHTDIRPNLLFQQKGWQKQGELQLRTRLGPPVISEETKVTCISNGGDGFVYIFEEDEDEKQALMKEVKEALLATEGIEKFIDKDEYEELGLPVAHKDSPDFIIECKKGYQIQTKPGEEVVAQSIFLGQHGYLPNEDDEMKVALIAHGPDIKPGIISEEIHSVDIAPTIAKTMGLDLKGADGKVLQQIIKP